MTAELREEGSDRPAEGGSAVSLDYTLYWRDVNSGEVDAPIDALVAAAKREPELSVGLRTPDARRASLIEEVWGMRPDHAAACRVSSGASVDDRQRCEQMVLRQCLEFLCGMVADALLLFNGEALMARKTEGRVQAYAEWEWGDLLAGAPCAGSIEMMDAPTPIG